jgi:hypothetical protein
VAFQDCLLYGFQVPPDKHTFERVSALLAQYIGIDRLLTQKQQIASVTLHLIRYLGIKGQVHEGASLYINGNMNRGEENRDHGYGKSVPIADAPGNLMEPLTKCMRFLGIDSIILPSRHGELYRGYLAKPQNIHIGTQLLAFCYTTRSALKALPKMLYLNTSISPKPDLSVVAPTRQIHPNWAKVNCSNIGIMSVQRALPLCSMWIPNSYGLVLRASCNPLMVR